MSIPFGDKTGPARARRILSAEAFQNFVGVGFDVDLVEDFLDLALLVNQEGLAGEAHVLAVAPGLLAVDAVSLGDGAVSVAQQREREVVLGDESLVRSLVVERDAENLDAGLTNGRVVVAERARLLGAARRVVLRVEVERDLLAA